MSKQVVLISHGKLSAGVADAVSMVFGKNEELSFLGSLPMGMLSSLSAVSAIAWQPIPMSSSS